MASKLLDPRRLRELHAATIEAGLADQRAALLQGIDAAFVAGLPVLPAPSAQILTDLHGLNLALGDGSVPIGCWLENAFVLAGPGAAGGVFEAALVELCLPLPARPLAASELPEARRAAPVPRADVVILAAAEDELESVLGRGDGGRRGWHAARDLQGFPYFRRSFAREGGGALVIAAAWIGAMGQDVDTALRGQHLVAELGPACLAMCGVCGGRRGKVALGDSSTSRPRRRQRSRCGRSSSTSSSAPSTPTRGSWISAATRRGSRVASRSIRSTRAGSTSSSPRG